MAYSYWDRPKSIEWKDSWHPGTGRPRDRNTSERKPAAFPIPLKGWGQRVLPKLRRRDVCVERAVFRGAVVVAGTCPWPPSPLAPSPLSHLQELSEVRRPGILLICIGRSFLRRSEQGKHGAPFLFIFLTLLLMIGRSHMWRTRHAFFPFTCYSLSLIPIHTNIILKQYAEQWKMNQLTWFQIVFILKEDKIASVSCLKIAQTGDDFVQCF